MRSEIKHPDRLRRMVALLERDAANPTGVKFDLGVWAAPAEEVDGMSPFIWPTELEVVPVSCHTRACAMGLAAISGEFKAEGLGYEYSPNANETGYLLVPSIKDEDGDEQQGFGAAAALFGITLGAAEYLFDPTNYDSCPIGAEGEKEVVERINEFLASNGSYTSCDEDDDDYEDDDDDCEDEYDCE